MMLDDLKFTILQANIKDFKKDFHKKIITLKFWKFLCGLILA